MGFDCAEGEDSDSLGEIGRRKVLCAPFGPKAGARTARVVAVEAVEALVVEEAVRR